MSKELFFKKKPIIQNEDFVIYSEVDLDNEKEYILKILTNKKQDLLDYFKLQNYDTIAINLFENQETYFDYRKNVKHDIPAPYSMGSFFEQEIDYVCTKQKKENIMSLVCGLIHECIHIFYMKIWKNKYDRVVWFDEGLAQYLSGQKYQLEVDDERFKNWYLSNIIGKDKEIPDISFLNSHGGNYGQFVDTVTNKYSGYALSYLIVRYLAENYDLSTFISNYSVLKKIEEHVLPDAINYYNNCFGIKLLKATGNYYNNQDNKVK